MTRPNQFAAGSLIAVAAVTAGGLALPAPAFGQIVGDRTLSDVKVNSVGACTTLTVTFNIRVQMLSHFPDSGRELHVRVRPLDASQALLARESLRPPANVPDLRSIEYEGDNPSGPVLSLLFTRDVRYEVEPGTDPQSLVIRLLPRAGDGACLASTTTQPARPALPEIGIPAGLYVVNLMSRPASLGELTPAQSAALSGKANPARNSAHSAAGSSCRWCASAAAKASSSATSSM